MQRETITVVRGVIKDRLEAHVSADQRFDVKRCVVIPRASNEQNQGWVQVSGYTVVAPAKADIKASDRALIRGEMHSVIGKPGDYGKKGLIVTFERVVANNA